MREGSKTQRKDQFTCPIRPVSFTKTVFSCCTYQKAALRICGELWAFSSTDEKCPSAWLALSLVPLCQCLCPGSYVEDIGLSLWVLVFSVPRCNPCSQEGWPTCQWCPVFNPNLTTQSWSHRKRLCVRSCYASPGSLIMTQQVCIFRSCALRNPKL